MRRSLAYGFCLTFFLFSHLAWGQERVTREAVDTAYMVRVEQMIDSLERVQKIKEVVRQYEAERMKEESSLHYEEMLPLLRGGIQYWSNKDFNDREGRFGTYDGETADIATEVAPLAVTYLLEIAGVKGRSKLPRLLTANAISIALNTGLCMGLKNTVHEWRPNRTDHKSFPSHHTALAFLGATILDREYGHLSPWISVGGYAAATSTALLRIQHNAHYINDVFMGAGIGVMSAQLGYFFADKIYGAEGIRQPHTTLHDLQRFARFWDCPTSLALLSGSNWTSKRIGEDAFQIMASDFGGKVTLRTASTYYTGVEYSQFLSRHWAVDVRLLAMITQVKADVSGSATLHAADVMGQHLNQWEGAASLKYSVPFKLEQRVSFRLSLGDCFTEETRFRYEETYSSASPSATTFLRIPRSHKLLVGGGIGVDVLNSRRYVAGIQIDYSHVFSPIFPNRVSISTLWRILL